MIPLVSSAYCPLCRRVVSTPGACPACQKEVTAQVTHLVELQPDVQLTMARLTVQGASLGVRVTSTPAKPLPYDTRAAEWLRKLRAFQRTWAIRVPRGDGPFWIALPKHAARLAGFNGFAAQVRMLVREGRDVVDLAPERIYIGTCQAQVETADGMIWCPAELYVMADVGYVDCYLCRTTWDVQERRTLLRAAVEDQLATAPELARAVHMIQTGLTAAAIHNLHQRGRLPRRGRNRRGVHLYRVGDVLDIAAQRAAALGAGKKSQ